MTNLIILFGYFIALIIIKNKKSLFLFFIAIIFCIIGTKISELSQSNSFIENELISPLLLSKSGEKLIGDLILNPTKSSSQKSSKKDFSHQSTGDDQLKFRSRAEIENRKFIRLAEDPIQAAKWMSLNNILVDSTAVLRGKFFHHYSTVLQPLRELEAGNYGYGLTSQYGLITLIPLVAIKNLPFTYYGLLSFCLLLIFGIFLIIRNKNSPPKMLVIASLISVIALSIDIPAVRLSPGFTYLRYFPLLALGFLANRQLSNPAFVMTAIIGIGLALLNSIQFNLLFIFSTFIGYVLVRIFYKGQSDLRIFYLPAAVFGVTCLQLMLYRYQSNAFTPSLFSSVGDGLRSTLYTVVILFLPISIKLLLATNIQNLVAIKDWEFPSLSFTQSEILAFIFYPLCATYAFSFAGSPQHFSGFMLMTSYSLYIIYIDNIKKLPKAAMSLLLLLAVPYYFGFLKVSQPFVDNSSKIYEYQAVGKTLVFKTALKIDQLSKEYDDITKDYINKGVVYFLSRDKVFIETQRNINLHPKIYDIYLNLNDQSFETIVDKLKKDNIKYLVLDGNQQRAFNMELIDVFGPEMNPAEREAHKIILRNIDSLANKLRDNVLRCNMRYCIYALN